MERITFILQNSGIRVLDANDFYVVLEDPTCFVRSIETFMDYAWIALSAITGLLLFGWAIAFIRGSSTSPLAINIRNLMLIFGVLSLAKPAINAIWGDDMFTYACKQIQIPTSEVERILAARDYKLKTRQDYDIYAEYEWNNATDLPGAGEPENISGIIVSGRHSRTNAVESGLDVIYTASDGYRYRRSGGSRAWRNNNPGNIRQSEFARGAGAIGAAGGFAVFPDEQTGMAAIKRLLRTESYARLTIGGTINRYAPPSENNTAGYQKRMEQLTGLPLNTPMAGLSDADFSRVVAAIRQIEGWKPGTQTRI